MIASLTGRLAFKAPTHLVLDVQGVGHDRGLVDRLRGPPTSGPALVRDDVPRDLEEPHPERGRALAVRRPGALLEPAEIGQGGEERAIHGEAFRVRIRGA